MLAGCFEKKDPLTNDLVLALKQTDKLEYKIVTTVSETYAAYSDMEERSLKSIQDVYKRQCIRRNYQSAGTSYIRPVLHKRDLSTLPDNRPSMY